MDVKEPAKRGRSSSGNSLQPPSNKQKLMDSAFRDSITLNLTSCQGFKLHSIKTEKQDLTEEDIGELRSGTLSAGQWVGPMGPAMFLDRFLPKIHDSMARPEFCSDDFTALFDIPDRAQKCGAFMDRVSRFSTGLEFVDTHSSRYTLQTVMNIGSHRAFADGQATVPELDFSRVEIPIIFKHENSDDPFCDDTEEDFKVTHKSDFSFERNDDAHLMTRGQIASCFSLLTGSQFRLHAFGVLVCGMRARILRWDPNGFIVTKGFSFAKDDSLVEFFWRYSQTPPDGRIRGHDPTVEILPSIYPEPTIEEIAARLKLIEANQNNHREFRTIMIPDRDTTKEYHFIISYPPRLIRESPLGRATRPMLAFDIDKNMMVFVKDYWRTMADDTDKEGEIYRILHEANVPYICPFGKGNDVQDHITLTDIVKVESWAYSTAQMKPLRHYRMSLEELGRPSNTFKSSHELVTAVADAMEAHEVAFYDANILHRDISAGNILITEDGRGMLIDWDLCLNMNNPNNKQKARRTGTWEFLSAMLLKDPQHVQGVLDDKESFLYVLLWNMMEYTPYNFSYRHSEEMELFEENRRALTKQVFLLSRFAHMTFDDRPPLNKLAYEFCDTIGARYEDEGRRVSAEVRQFMGSEEGIALLPNNLVVRERQLVERSWFVKTMRKYLEPRSAWPEADKARKNPRTSTAYRRRP